MVVKDVLGKRLSEPEVLAAVIGTMTPTELVSNMKLLERKGVKDHAITRAALEAGVEKAATRKAAGKGSLKASVAAQALEDAGDSVGAGKLRALQEKQLDVLKGVDGDWLVAADKSQSMSTSIEAAKEIAAVLARMVKGKVYLVFFNGDVTPYEATGKTLEEIKTMTRFEKSGGGTLIGQPVNWLVANGHSVDGIVVVSDGGDNRPRNFAEAYQRYVRTLGNEPSVYFYKVKGQDPDRLTDTMEMTKFDLTAGVDYTSLPNLVQTMRVGKFSLVDEIMGTALRTLDEVLDRTKGVEVVKRELVHA
jgi:hypothetical protein